MERWVGRVALVTGASAGCGAKIAEILTKHGMKVVGCARNTAAIQTLSQSLGSGSNLTAIQCDVTKEDDVIKMFTEIKRQFGRLDVCINNAGLSHVAPLLSGTTEHWRNMLEVNVLGVAVCTREAVKAMKECGAGDGQIINVNSGLGHFVSKGADTTFYSATKFAVTALTEGTRTELRQSGSNIRVCQLSPWLIRTEFRPRMMGLSEEEADKFYGDRPCLSVDDVAGAVVYTLSAPPSLQVRDILFSNSQNS